MNMVCSRCKQRMAIVYISKIEDGKQVSEGYCLKCARELGIPQVTEMMDKFGISDEDVDNISNQMNEIFDGEEGDFELGGAMPFPSFLQNFVTSLTSSDDKKDEEIAEYKSEKTESGKKSEKKAEAPRKKRKFLDGYCENLTAKAKEGRIDNIIGRDGEIYRVMQILNRRQKNNPCLIGEPGVGKTAIAEGIAQRLANGDVPPRLSDKELYLLDLTALVAGTQFRGQFESRVKGLVEDVKAAGNVILFIDEVHNLIGTGGAEGSMNAANILKPALSRGEIQVIGATTFSEYRKHIEKDAALERRFQPVKVDEPSIEETIKVLMGIKRYYEDFHRVSVPEDVIRRAVTMSERYITDRFLPDKAIDLIDEACSDINLKNKNLARMAVLQREKDDLDKEREMLLAANSENENDFARLAEIRSRQLQLEQELTELNASGYPELTMSALARVIELWTKIPASSIREDEFERLAKLDERLKAHIVGQDEAIKTVCSAIKRNRVGISAKRKPVSFIFVGSTGVGKTELVKQLAADMFSTPESLIRLDMSEFMEKHAVSRIIGSPPGYVGYDEAGQLTEKIRRKPYSVILFDEIEKAHPDVLNIMLQILDDGHITDAHGRTVNFENTIIVMTTNAGSERKGSGSVGFNQTVAEQGREKAMKALNDFLRPEFINRVDEIVYFNQLSEDNFKGIADIMMRELHDSMAEKGYSLGYDDALLTYLVEKSYSATYGARNLRRTIQREVEDAITELIISRYMERLRYISVTAKDGKIDVQGLT